MDEPTDELRRWLADHGLDDVDVMAELPNEVIDAMDPWQVRALHAFLEARWQLDHPARPSPSVPRRVPAEELEPRPPELGEEASAEVGEEPNQD